MSETRNHQGHLTIESGMDSMTISPISDTGEVSFRIEDLTIFVTGDNIPAIIAHLKKQIQ